MSGAIARKPTRAKVCKCGCGEKFVPKRQIQPTRDNFDCKVRYAEKVAAKSRAAREQKERQVIRDRREKLKTRSDWMKEAQIACNQYVRLRDRIAGHLCISSNRPLDWSGNNVDAGHYRSRGSAPNLRFNEFNMAAQSKQDNRYGGGCATDFRIGLISRYGLEIVEAIEADNYQRKYTIAELIEIRDLYRWFARALLAQEKVAA